MSNKRPKGPKKVLSSGCVFDGFHKNVAGKIVATTMQPRLDPMDMLRPAPFKAKEYDINQTYAIMDRGPVKIRYTNTDAEYEWHPEGYKPPTPKPRDKRGRILDLLLEEEWAIEVEKMQAKCRARLAVVSSNRRKTNRKDMKRAIADISKLSGPAWYQDLSNDQRRTVDNLAKCILMDLRTNSICNTQENLARLGLVLRPNPDQIRIALCESCRCPIEFLQVLYQVTNTRRTEYSVNDRIILSSIVHLSIRETLKELHIRIPSPPRFISKPKKVKQPRRIKPVSPYLDRFIYIPPPRTTITRPHQGPQNEYFDYINDLRENTIWLCTDKEEELNEGLNMVNKLLMQEEEGEENEDLDPFTIMEQELVGEWLRAQQLYNKLAVGDCIMALNKPSVYIPCINRISSGFKEIKTTKQKQTTRKQDSKLNNTPTASSASKENNSDSSDGIQCVYNNSPTCNLAPDYYSCMDCGCEYPGECLDGESFIVEAPEDPDDTQVSQSCPCALDNGPKYNLLEPAVAESLQCVCRQKTLERIETCHCQCELCIADREKANAKRTKIIVDTAEDKDGEAVKIIGGIKSEKICTCLEKYQKRWDLWEKRQEIKKTQAALKSLREKFIITGVATAPDGKPIFILGGVKPKDDCPCYHMEEHEAARQKELAVIAEPLPEGCIQYTVSGVQARPEGNIYVISGASPNPDYNCSDLYKNFAENHATCMRLYEEYMKKIEYELEEYMHEMNPKYQDFTPQESEEPKIEEPPVCECVCRCEQSPTKCELYPKPEMEAAEEDNLICDEAETGLDCTCSQYERVSSSSDSSSCGCQDGSNLNSKYEEKSRAKTKTKKFGGSEEEGFEHSSRYIILKHFPNDLGLQYLILKRALAKLADDGFPLAKLPDVYLLPHFKLWLQMRAKKYWIGKDKVKYNILSKYYAEKSSKVLVPPRKPEPTFLANDPSKHNWKYRNYIKYHNDIIAANYYRGAKEVCINDTKFFYPICFPYEFPSKYFRDVYFAYLPNKIESIYPFRPWLTFEVKQMENSRRC